MQGGEADHLLNLLEPALALGARQRRDRRRSRADNLISRTGGAGADTAFRGSGWVMMTKVDGSRKVTGGLRNHALNKLSSHHCHELAGLPGPYTGRGGNE